MDNPERHLREALDEIRRLLKRAQDPPIATADVRAPLERVQKSVETALRMLEGQ